MKNHVCVAWIQIRWITALLTLFQSLPNCTSRNLLRVSSQATFSQETWQRLKWVMQWCKNLGPLNTKWLSSYAVSPLHYFVFSYWLAATIGCHIVASRASMCNPCQASRPRYTLPPLSRGNRKKIQLSPCQMIESMRIEKSCEPLRMYCMRVSKVKSETHQTEQNSCYKLSLKIWAGSNSIRALTSWPLSTRPWSTLNDSCSCLTKA